ncbi:putative zeaxanthin epoxidase [Helianthus anomalus]
MAKKSMEVVKGIDLARYMGRWYEIASFPSRFQPKNGINMRATHTLRDDGTVNVLNAAAAAVHRKKKHQDKTTHKIKSRVNCHH